MKHVHCYSEWLLMDWAQFDISVYKKMHKLTKKATTTTKKANATHVRYVI